MWIRLPTSIIKYDTAPLSNREGALMLLFDRNEVWLMKLYIRNWHVDFETDEVQFTLPDNIVDRYGLEQFVTLYPIKDRAR